MTALPLTIDGDDANICHAGLYDLVEGGEVLTSHCLRFVNATTRTQKEKYILAIAVDGGIY